MNYRNKVLLIILLAYCFRTFFGLSYEFWFIDNLQVYLLGLKYYTTGIWPYWGPDVVHTNSAIPGALQGLLTGVPFYILKIPEAPNLFLNLLTISALTFFAWYLTRRFSSLPKLIILVWVFTVPSAMYYSTEVQNPSYVLFGSVLFFISILEIFPFYKEKIIPKNFLFFILGFALFWIYQLHLSWILLLPFITLSFYFKFSENKSLGILLKSFLFFLFGCITTFSIVFPTLKEYGNHSTEALASNIHFNFSNIYSLFAIVFDFINYSVYDLERLLPNNSIKDGQLFFILKKHFWIVPLALFLFIVRIFQSLFLITAFWKFKGRIEGWNKVRAFIIFSIGIIWFSFLFTDHWPNVHKYYLIMPVSLWYSLHVYQEIYRTLKWKNLYPVILTCGVLFYISMIGIYQCLDRTLYSNRQAVSRAIEEKDYTLLGVRRQSDFYKNQIENTWKRKSSMDTIIFSNDFEYKDKNILPQNITSKSVHSGFYSCKIDSVQPFGIGFETSCELVKNTRELIVSFWVSCDQETDGILVISVYDDKKSLFWSGINLKDLLGKSKGFKKVTYKFFPPDNINQSPNSKFAIYPCYLKKGREVLYVDDLEIIFLNNKKIQAGSLIKSVSN